MSCFQLRTPASSYLDLSEYLFGDFYDLALEVGLELSSRRLQFKSFFMTAHEKRAKAEPILRKQKKIIKTELPILQLSALVPNIVALDFNHYPKTS